jgi:hypothetical protein
MKTTVVAAQVTTVEDRIAGNLSFTQLLLLAVPVFFGAALFAAVPPFMNISALKLALVTILAITCAILAIRIKGKLVLHWITILVTYVRRPRFYVYNKNDVFLRPLTREKPSTANKLSTPVTIQVIPSFSASLPDVTQVRLEQTIANPKANFHFRVKKGGLRVYIREVKKESI